MHQPIKSYPVETIIKNENNKHNISIKIARLDLIHPIVSGNKLFKLYYFVEKAKQLNKEKLITKGGAFSNHLIATAFYCKEMKIQAIGIIRGEQPQHLNHTLSACLAFGMQLIYVSRKDFDLIHNIKDLNESYLDENNSFFIPEGGYHPLGAIGASLIMEHPELKSASHICTALGTSTTLAGLIIKSEPKQEIIGIPALKGLTDISERLEYLLETSNFKTPTIWTDYDFGGYAKSSGHLIEFINNFYSDFRIPSDFVYTGKAFFAVMDQFQKGYFPNNSNVIIIHTGGLQGNRSKPKGTFIF